MRKVDAWLIPWLCLLYLLSFLDRTNIGEPLSPSTRHASLISIQVTLVSPGWKKISA